MNFLKNKLIKYKMKEMLKMTNSSSDEELRDLKEKLDNLKREMGKEEEIEEEKEKVRNSQTEYELRWLVKAEVHV